MNKEALQRQKDYAKYIRIGPAELAVKAFQRKPYETIDVVEYLKGKGVDTSGQVEVEAVQGIVKGAGA